MYNNCQITQDSDARYIDVYNNTSPNVLVRYAGIYHTPTANIPYRTLSFGTNDHLRFEFPANTISTTFIIQMFNSTTSEWQDITQSVMVLFPGTYCYRVSGTFDNPQVNQIPCPPPSSIIVYNDTSPNALIRYGGVYRTPTGSISYRTLSFGTNMHWIVKFPDSAISTTFIIQIFDSTSGEWRDITQSISLSFPGNYCYRVLGSFNNPQVNQIPCPTANNLNNNNICCNTPQIC